jgi:hypothetical protein
MVALRDLKAVRRLCHLAEEDGVDADAFYSQECFVAGASSSCRVSVIRRASAILRAISSCSSSEK